MPTPSNFLQEAQGMAGNPGMALPGGLGSPEAMMPEEAMQQAMMLQQQQSVMSGTSQAFPPVPEGAFGTAPSLSQFKAEEKKPLKVKKTNDEIIAILKDDKKIAVDFYNAELKEKFEDWEQQFEGIPEYYNTGDFRMPTSCYVSRDIMTTIRAVMPDIMKLLLVKEPVEIVGRTEEDVPKAQKMQALCNWQLTRLNNFHTIVGTALNEALLKGISVCKVSWIKEVETRIIQELLHQDEVFDLEQQGIKLKDHDYVGEDEYGSVYYCEYEADVVVKNFPKLDILPSVEFLFDPTAKSIDEAKYCIHRKIVTKDYLKRKELEGVYSNVDDIKWTGSSYVEDEEELYRVEHGFRPDDNTIVTDTARQDVVINEYWGKLDLNNDGLLEDVVITFCGDTILSIEENTFDKYPFFIFSPYPSVFRIYGMGIAEMVESIQTAKTAFMRELLENTRRNNDRKIFYREGAFLAPSQMNDPKQKYVSIDERVPLDGVVASEPFEQLSPNIVDTIEYLDKVRQMVTGVSELKQGVNAQDKSTATEASIKYEASNAQVQMIAVNFSYTFKDIYEFVVYANQKFIDDKTVIRLLNESIEIDPEDLQGVFDLSIACALGTGTAESRRVALNNVLLTMIQVAEPRGLTDGIKIRNVLARIIEESGLKDVDSYLKTEEQIMQEQQQAMMQQQQMAQMQQEAAQLEMDNAQAQTAQNEAQAMQDMGVMPPQENGQMAGASDGMINADLRGL